MPRIPKVAVIDSVGAHRGMHYYNFGLISALDQLAPGNFALISTADTVAHPLCPSEIIAYSGFRGIYGDAPTWRRGLHYFQSLLRVERFIRHQKPDIAQFHFYQVPRLDKILLNRLRQLKIKIVTTVHDVLPFDSGTDFASVRGGIHHQLYAMSSGLVIHSDYAREAVSSLDATLLEKVIEVPLGGYQDVNQYYSLGRSEARDGLGLNSEDCIILIFGTIKPNKRLDLAIKALKLLIDTHPGVKLIIAGKPQDRTIEDDRALAQKLGIDSNIVWRIGYQTDQEMGALFSAADITLFPYSWIYQSAALLMAMSFAKPVVATDVPGNASLITHGVNGILTPLDSPDQLAVELLRLVDEPDRRTAIGNAAHEFVSVEQSWPSIASKMLDFYVKLCADCWRE